MDVPPLPAKHNGIAKSVQPLNELTPRKNKKRARSGDVDQSITKAPRVGGLKQDHKNVHSRAYHKARLDAIRSGMDVHKAKDCQGPSQFFSPKAAEFTSVVLTSRDSESLNVVFHCISIRTWTTNPNRFLQPTWVLDFLQEMGRAAAAEAIANLKAK